MRLRDTCAHAVSLAGLIIAGVVFASTAHAQTVRNAPVIHDRKENQQDRIAQGVRSGQLTPRETARLESKEARLNRETRAMRRHDGGKLTSRDKKIVTAQQNHLSRNIYRAKHNRRQQ